MTDSTPPGVFVERILDYVVADAPPRTVTVRIYQPVQRGPYEWQARVVISGLDAGMDHEFGGLDGVQALFEALRMAGGRARSASGALARQVQTLGAGGVSHACG